MKLDERSLRNLEGVHNDLIAVTKLAAELSPYEFVVTEGVRSREQQKENVRKGVSKTMDSLHLIQKDGKAHAIDFAVRIDGKIVWKPWGLYEAVAEAFLKAAKSLAVPVTWGGSWENFRDGCHIQLPRDYLASQ